jgi:hypothetical protein
MDPRPIATGLDTNQARRQLLKELQDVTTLQLPAHHYLAGGINAMHLKDRFSDVETDGRNRLHDLAPPNRGSSAGTDSWHSRAGGGAVHSIKSGQRALQRTKNATTCYFTAVFRYHASKNS